MQNRMAIVLPDSLQRREKFVRKRVTEILPSAAFVSLDEALECELRGMHPADYWEQ
jgi:hypothetical protein